MDDLRETDNDGRTWIHHSVRKTEPLECLKSLLSPETMKLRDNEGRTCLHVAAEQGSVHACRLIFEMNEQIEDYSYIHIGDNYRQTPLHLATKNGHARVLKELLDHGADPHLRGIYVYLLYVQIFIDFLYLDSHGISAFDYAQNRGLYFCRSVFEVYLRDRHANGVNDQLSTQHSNNNYNNATKSNGFDVAPTPPVDGHARFIRHKSLRLTESLPQPIRPSPTLSVETLTNTGSYPNNSSIMTNRPDDNKDEDDDEINLQCNRAPSSTTNVSMTGPPVKPRKTSNISNTSLTNMLNMSLVNTSKSKRNHYQHRIAIATVQSDGDEDDEPNSLEGHGGQSDFEDDDQSPRFSRPDSRLSIRNSDYRLHQQQQQQQQQSNFNFRRSHYKHAKNSHRQSLYDDYRFLDEQQQQFSPFVKSKHHHRATTNKDFPYPSSNRIGSGSGNQSATNRLKSGSKSSSNESIPTLDLTVAGQKVFRTKQSSDMYVSNTLPSAGSMNTFENYIVAPGKLGSSSYEEFKKNNIILSKEYQTLLRKYEKKRRWEYGK